MRIYTYVEPYSKFTNEPAYIFVTEKAIFETAVALAKEAGVEPPPLDQALIEFCATHWASQVTDANIRNLFHPVRAEQSSRKAR